MDKPILNDSDQFPTDELIFSHIGTYKTYWETIFHDIENSYPELKSEWRYYNDGKNWLLKTVRKTKTIFWLAVFQESFRITFYFGDKAEPAIMASPIPRSLKESFEHGKRFGKIRAITIQVNSETDVENIKSLIELKLSVK